MPRTTTGRAGARAGYGLTCSKCRARKMKCDGRRPECAICLAYGERCNYDKPPSMSQVFAMRDRIQELERAVAQHQEERSSPAGINNSPAPSNRAAAAATSSSLATDTMVGIEANDRSQTTHTPQYQSTSAVDEPVAETGEAQFAFNATPSASEAVTPMTEQEILQWETSALQVCPLLVHLSTEKLSHLLETHWTWVHPTFLFIPRPYFLRAASCGGEHFSTLLLNVICLHSTRFTDHSMSDDLLARVRLLLGQELHKESAVPMAQALLQLSAREIGRGARSQAWLYSGMAFRMVIDLGCFSKRTLASEDPVTRLIKEHLAWSSYLWDKAISLYLGKAPVLPEAPEFDPPLSDPAAEHMTWTPYSKGSVNAESQSMTSYTMTCFKNFCLLGKVINSILLNIYAKRMTANATAFREDMKNQLDSWRASSPAHLKVDRLTLICPPPHILTQNLLFHATSILLHRPFWGDPSCQAICRKSAEEVEHLFLLLEKSFGLEHVTYLMAYCAYTAATVAVMDASQTRINTYLRALFAVRSSCPGIQTSIDLIIQSFSTSSKPRATSTSVSPNAPQEQIPDPLPAFPFDFIQENEYGGFGDMDSIPFADLDAFPFEWSTGTNDFGTNI